jgi:hypothetical protein
MEFVSKVNRLVAGIVGIKMEDIITININGLEDREFKTKMLEDRPQHIQNLLRVIFQHLSFELSIFKIINNNSDNILHFDSDDTCYKTVSHGNKFHPRRQCR